MQPLDGPGPIRIAWTLLPLAVGPALGDALDGSSRAVELTGATVAWGTWATVLVAILLPRTLSLTALRIAAPAALAAASWAALTGQRGTSDIVALTVAAVTAFIAFAPTTGDCFINGSAYGNERRMPLRVPGALLFGPLELAWVAAIAAPVSVPLLLASKQWLAAGAMTVVGTPAAVLSVRALHGLSRRWIVFVPAGVVLHDLHAMVDPVLFPRPSIHRLGPAPHESDGALDLTRQALGLALEIELAEPAELALRRRDGSAEVELAQLVMFTPTRPGAVLSEAARRGIEVGAPGAQAT
ncbi:MAG: hypothetical protein WD691_07720 [Acidimicrobiales bacterium]